MQKGSFLSQFALVLISSATLRADFVAWEERFDSDASFAKSSRFFSDQAFDYFGISSIGADDDYDDDTATPPLILHAYTAGTTGLDGKYLAGEDLLETTASGGALPHVLTWSGISISGLTDLEFQGDFAANDGGVFESFGSLADSIQIDVQIDSGGFETVLRFEPGALFGDLQLAGGSGVLGLTAQTFTSGITGAGDSLDVRLTLITNDNNEAFAIDNLQVLGTAIPEASQVLALAIVGAMVLSWRGVRSRERERKSTAPSLP